MFCTSKEQETCEVEKYGCEGCYYNSKEIEEKLKLSKVDGLNFKFERIDD